MESLTIKAQRDNRIMKLLKLGEIRHIVANTDKGELTLCLRLGDKAKDYRFVLDAVPVSESDSKKLFNEYDGVLFNL